MPSKSKSPKRGLKKSLHFAYLCSQACVNVMSVVLRSKSSLVLAPVLSADGTQNVMCVCEASSLSTYSGEDDELRPNKAPLSIFRLDVHM